jgi:hypothetical protein
MMLTMSEQSLLHRRNNRGGGGSGRRAGARVFGDILGPSVRQHLGDHVPRAQAADAGCHGQTVIGHVHHAVQKRVHCQHLKKKTSSKQ